MVRFCCGYKCWQFDDGEQKNIIANNKYDEHTVDTRTINPVQSQITPQIGANIELSVEDV